MEITEVRIFPKEGQRDKKLKAYATITLDNAFVVRNVKVIEGNKGLFVAMPSRKLKVPCPKCGHRNAIRSKHCNQCAVAIPPPAPLPPRGSDGERQSEHRDIAHPITLECREYIQKKVLDAYGAEKGTGGSTPGSSSKPSNAPPRSREPESPKPPQPPEPPPMPQGPTQDIEL